MNTYGLGLYDMYPARDAMRGGMVAGPFASVASVGLGAPKTQTPRAAISTSHQSGNPFTFNPFCEPEWTLPLSPVQSRVATAPGASAGQHGAYAGPRPHTASATGPPQVQMQGYARPPDPFAYTEYSHAAYSEYPAATHEMYPHPSVQATHAQPRPEVTEYDPCYEHSHQMPYDERHRTLSTSSPSPHLETPLPETPAGEDLDPWRGAIVGVDGAEGGGELPPTGYVLPVPQSHAAITGVDSSFFKENPPTTPLHPPRPHINTSHTSFDSYTSSDGRQMANSSTPQTSSIHEAYLDGRTSAVAVDRLVASSNSDATPQQPHAVSNNTNANTAANPSAAQAHQAQVYQTAPNTSPPFATHSLSPTIRDTPLPSGYHYTFPHQHSPQSPYQAPMYGGLAYPPAPAYENGAYQQHPAHMVQYPEGQMAQYQQQPKYERGDSAEPWSGGSDYGYNPRGGGGRQPEPILAPGEEPVPRPTKSYAALIGEALLLSKPPHQLYVSDISESIKNRYQYYRQNPSKIYNGVRHQTSMCKAFVKLPRPFGDQSGGARKWAIRDGCQLWFRDGNYNPPLPVVNPRTSRNNGGKSRPTARNKELALGTGGAHMFEDPDFTNGQGPSHGRAWNPDKDPLPWVPQARQNGSSVSTQPTPQAQPRALPHSPTVHHGMVPQQYAQYAQYQQMYGGYPATASPAWQYHNGGQVQGNGASVSVGGGGGGGGGGAGSGGGSGGGGTVNAHAHAHYASAGPGPAQGGEWDGWQPQRPQFTEFERPPRTESPSPAPHGPAHGHNTRSRTGAGARAPSYDEYEKEGTSPLSSASSRD